VKTVEWVTTERIFSSVTKLSVRVNTLQTVSIKIVINRKNLY